MRSGLRGLQPHHPKHARCDRLGRGDEPARGRIASHAGRGIGRPWHLRRPSTGLPAQPYTAVSARQPGLYACRANSRLLSPNDHFTLGDIATIDASEDLKRALAGAQLGDTPVIGKKLSLSRKAIIDALGKLGFDTSDFNLRLPRSAEVHRSSQPLPADSISKVAIAAAGPILGQDAELRAEVVAPDVAVPLGKIELYAETCVQTQSGATVIVVTKINGSRYDSHVVRVIVDRVARSHS